MVATTILSEKRAGGVAAAGAYGQSRKVDMSVYDKRGAGLKVVIRRRGNRMPSRLSKRGVE